MQLGSHLQRVMYLRMGRDSGAGTSMKKIIQLVFALLSLAVPLLAQTYDGLTIPDGHPRLYWNAERIAQGQAWLAAHPYTPGTCAVGYQGYCLDVAFQHLMNASDCSSAITVALTVAANGPAFYEDREDAERDLAEMPLLVYDWCYDQL